MKVIYVDESGSPSVSHSSRFYVASGVIFDVDDFDLIEGMVLSFKDKMLGGRFKEGEIHLYDIIEGKGEFRGVAPDERRRAVSEIYSMLESLPFSIITVAIDKHSLEPHRRSDAAVMEMLYDSLVTRFDLYIRRMHDKGMIMFDRISNRPYALSKADVRIMNSARKIIKRGI